MKFSEFTKKRRFSNGFYLIIALCLLSLGAASYFAFSGISKNENPENTLPKTEYIAPDNTYTEKENENDKITEEITPAGETEKEVPYEEPKEETKISFQKPLDGEIILKHSETELQFSKTFSDMRIHTGIDICSPYGTAVTAIESGVVVEVGYDINYGNFVEIETGDFLCRYTSLESGIKIKSGDEVSKGDTVGYLSDSCISEICDEPHLHFEMKKDGEYVNPAEYIY